MNIMPFDNFPVSILASLYRGDHEVRIMSNGTIQAGCMNCTISDYRLHIEGAYDIDGKQELMAAFLDIAEKLVEQFKKSNDWRFAMMNGYYCSTTKMNRLLRDDEDDAKANEEERRQAAERSASPARIKSIIEEDTQPASNAEF